MRKRKICKYIFYILLTILFLLPIIIFIIEFHSYTLSNDTANWGDFGDYIGGIYSISITLLAVFLTFYLTKKDEKRKKRIEAIIAINDKIDKCYRAMNDTTRLKYVANLIKEVEHDHLFIPEALYKELGKLIDDYSEGNPIPESYQRVMMLLKQSYDE